MPSIVVFMASSLVTRAPPHEGADNRILGGEIPTQDLLSTAMCRSARLPRLDTMKRWLGAWGAVAFVLLDLVLIWVFWTVAILVFVGAAAIPSAGVGLIILIPALWVTGWLAVLERSRIVSFTGVSITPPAERDQEWWRRLLLDPIAWKAAAYTALQPLWGLIEGTIVLGALGQALAIVVSPFFVDVSHPHLTILWWFTIRGTTAYVLAWVVSLVVIAAIPFVAHALSRVTVHLAQWLIGQDRDHEIAELNSRVDTLTTTRQETVDSVEAERRRIERDLHDGPQQQLVAVAMDLGMAREIMDRDPTKARELLEHAHDGSKSAIIEMRQVARGIVPPILSDRGLEPAILSLAGRSPVPVSVDVRIPPGRRLDPTVEAIAYFSVSEALTNVAKHSQASHARVDADLTAPNTLHVVISDDGRGGARIGGGSGLAGLQHRVRAVDGSLLVSSPEGGPTVVTIDLPLRERAAL